MGEIKFTALEEAVISDRYFFQVKNKAPGNILFFRWDDEALMDWVPADYPFSHF